MKMASKAGKGGRRATTFGGCTCFLCLCWHCLVRFARNCYGYLSDLWVSCYCCLYCDHGVSMSYDFWDFFFVCIVIAVLIRKFT
jgi:hypothetical protein